MHSQCTGYAQYSLLSVKYVHSRWESFVEQKCGMVQGLYLSWYEKS
jgi:hypothetical protein